VTQRGVFQNYKACQQAFIITRPTWINACLQATLCINPWAYYWTGIYYIFNVTTGIPTSQKNDNNYIMLVFIIYRPGARGNWRNITQSDEALYYPKWWGALPEGNIVTEVIFIIYRPGARGIRHNISLSDDIFRGALREILRRIPRAEGL
jgi:cbb3-type cytochrome oxidase subunit 3